MLLQILQKKSKEKRHISPSKHIFDCKQSVHVNELVDLSQKHKTNETNDHMHLIIPSRTMSFTGTTQS